MKTPIAAKLSAILGAILLAGALMTTGCDNTDDTGCVGAGCLDPFDGVDAGDSHLTCHRVCTTLFEYCDGIALPKQLADDNPETVDECVLLCEKSGLSLDERRCLFEAGCDDTPFCF